MSDSEKGVVELCAELAALAQSRGIGRMEGVSMVNIDPDSRDKALVEIKLPNGKHLILDAELRDDWTQTEYPLRPDSDAEDLFHLCMELGGAVMSHGMGQLTGVSLVNVDPDVNILDSNNKALVEIELPNGKHLILTAELRDDWTKMEYFQRTDPVISQFPEELIEAVKDAELRGEDIGETIKSFKKPRH